MKPFRLIIPVAAALLGLGLVGLGLWSGRENLTLVMLGTRSTATVVDFRMQAHYPRGWTRQVELSFALPDGRRVLTMGRNSSDAAIGERVPVLFDPGRPERVYLPNEASFWLVPMGLVGCGLFACLFAFAYGRNGGPRLHRMV